MALPAFLIPLISALISGASQNVAGKAPPAAIPAQPTGGTRGQGPVIQPPGMPARPPLQQPRDFEFPELVGETQTPAGASAEKNKGKLSDKDWNEILGATAAALQVAGPLLGLGPQQEQRVMPAPIPGGPGQGNVQFKPPQAQSLGELLAGLRVR